jgi:hypothetical protein
MTDVVTKAALTPARKRLIELMQEINYGRIESLMVRNGEPVFDPPPMVNFFAMFRTGYASRIASRRFFISACISSVTFIRSYPLRRASPNVLRAAAPASKAH